MKLRRFASALVTSVALLSAGAGDLPHVAAEKTPGDPVLVDEGKRDGPDDHRLLRPVFADAAGGTHGIGAAASRWCPALRADPHTAFHLALM